MENEVRVKDLTGKKFGKLEVVNKNLIKSGKNSYWDCICDCGNHVTVSRCNLMSGHTKSCGCINKANDLSGKRFGKLTVVERDTTKKHRHPVWKCQCDCGNEVFVRGSSLLGGTTTSCGCSRYLDLTNKRFGKLTAIKRIEPHYTSGENKCTVWECICDCGTTINVILSDLQNGSVKSCGCLRNKCTYEKNEGGFVTGRDCNGNEFYFDEEDFEILSQYVWYVDNGYVITRIDQKRVSMHRMLLNPDINKEVDHINGNKSDNRKWNLRICDHVNNMWNKGVYKNNTTGIKGVTHENGGYRARIVANSEIFDLGFYKTKEAAALARLEAEYLHKDYSYYKREDILNERKL